MDPYGKNEWKIILPEPKQLALMHFIKGLFTQWMITISQTTKTSFNNRFNCMRMVTVNMIMTQRNDITGITFR